MVQAVEVAALIDVEVVVLATAARPRCDHRVRACNPNVEHASLHWTRDVFWLRPPAQKVLRTNYISMRPRL